MTQQKESSIPPQEWFSLSDEDLQAMPDGILANAFTEAVKLVHKVITAGGGHRTSIYASPEDAARLYDRLSGEIAMRNKQWAPMIFGGVAVLEDGRGEVECGFYRVPTRTNGDYFGRICLRRDGHLNTTTRRVRCGDHEGASA